jgi:hypothetical protein
VTAATQALEAVNGAASRIWRWTRGSVVNAYPHDARHRRGEGLRRLQADRPFGRTPAHRGNAGVPNSVQPDAAIAGFFRSKRRSRLDLPRWRLESPFRAISPRSAPSKESEPKNDCADGGEGAAWFPGTSGTRGSNISLSSCTGRPRARGAAFQRAPGRLRNQGQTALEPLTGPWQLSFRSRAILRGGPSDEPKLAKQLRIGERPLEVGRTSPKRSRRGLLLQRAAKPPARP